MPRWRNPDRYNPFLHAYLQLGEHGGMYAGLGRNLICILFMSSLCPAHRQSYTRLRFGSGCVYAVAIQAHAVAIRDVAALETELTLARE